MVDAPRLRALLSRLHARRVELERYANRDADDYVSDRLEGMARFRNLLAGPARADRDAELLLRLNHGDNHGVRAGLMNLLLRDGDDEAALVLAAAFEHDMLAEIPYGRVLALVRLGRLKEGAEAARQAVRRLPEVRRYLMRERAARPEIADFGIRIGGKDQAWIYREEMRDVWLENPDVLALIRKTRPG
ncbi:MAG TPA: hypothetical protein VMR74_05605 [Gammaproteobacteria bacterium]|nr:hypothetical protein [Gammaproteobacteria bacterium]